MFPGPILAVLSIIKTDVYRPANLCNENISEWGKYQSWNAIKLVLLICPDDGVKSCLVVLI